MTLEEIDERYRDAALDDDTEQWEDGDAGGKDTGWDDPAELSDDDPLEDDDA